MGVMSGRVSGHDPYKLRLTLPSWAGAELRRGGEQVPGRRSAHALGSCSAWRWEGTRLVSLRPRVAASRLSGCSQAPGRPAR